MIKRFFSLLLMLSIVLSFPACHQAGEEQTSALESTETASDAATVEEVAEGVFQKSDIGKFKIVYAVGLEDDTMTSIRQLANMINSTCDTQIVSTNEWILENNEKTHEWEHEILIGCTNREESAAFGESLRLYDYGYGYVDGKIVIYGNCEAYLKNAINSFMVNVLLAHKTEEVFYDSSWSSVVKYHYTVDQLTVNGAPIQDYEIIYAASSSLYEYEMAERLHCYILENTGYDLTVKKDSEVREGAPAFHVGKTQYVAELVTDVPAGRDGVILCDGGDVVVCGSTVLGMVNASKRLTELLVDPNSRETVRTVNLDSVIAVEASEAYSVMTFNVFTGDMTANRIARVMDAIYRYMPDVLGLQEANLTWINKMIGEYSSYYGFVGTDLSDGKEGVPILYSTVRFNLIESGTQWLTDTPDTPSRLPNQQYNRNFTYALLEDKETGERFLALNTHLDTGGSAVRYAEAELLMQFLKSYNDVPVVLLGDLNAKRNTNEMNLFKDAGLDSVYDYSDLKGMKSNASAIDWILMTSDSLSMTYHTFDDSIYDGAYPSDHYPYYAEFTVKDLGDETLDHGWIT